ncbi:MAG: HAMP domain-containing histidine kinase [Campylobacteraceae bacterium]|nr:HAMP domain-containing histidine kinase [Campylobacteraceae bacterium]
MSKSKQKEILLLSKEKVELKTLNEELEKRVKEELKKSRAKDELMFQQSKLASMGEMIGNISHQWRQPLMEISSLFLPIEASLKMNIELSKEDLIERIEKLHEITKYMSHTIDDFKNFFSKDKKKVNFRISEQINTAITIIGSTLKRNKINLDIIIKHNPLVYGYKNEYAQVLINIATNACDILINRKITNPKIIIKIETKDNFLLVSLSDNAGGIKVNPISKVFEPFYTSEKDNGTGLGLFMSHLIVRNSLKGEILVSNNKEGAVFIIKIPIDIKDD